MGKQKIKTNYKDLLKTLVFWEGLSRKKLKLSPVMGFYKRWRD